MAKRKTKCTCTCEQHKQDKSSYIPPLMLLIQLYRLLTDRD
jgi:hypothetical protein